MFHSFATSRWLRVFACAATILFCLSLIPGRPLLGVVVTSAVVVGAVLVFVVSTVRRERTVNRRSARAFAEATGSSSAARVEEVPR
jgi:type III secretory pathway component EscV